MALKYGIIFMYIGIIFISEKRLTMENTLDKKEINTDYEDLTSMDFGNSFDYTNDYYITVIK